MVSSVSNIDSKGYSISLVGSDVYSQNDQLFVTFKQPLRVTSGNMILTTANGLNLDDSISFADQTVNLSPASIERALTIGYTTELDNHANMVVLLNHRNNPNHDDFLKSEHQIMIKINKKF
ncbi:Serine protease, subtilase family [uncultured Candidatus Thioglobus sp.]|nr:Serine protease, subtilase family [uncultured Candidatus Thioglobus sp.]